jgi:ATP-dependent Clp protease ATP-binding subunit ClpC
VDFKNTAIIMTSNVGSSELRRVGRLGFIPTKSEEEELERVSEARRDHALEGLRQAFRPEFLNRIDQVIVFHALSRLQMRQIVDLLLTQVHARLGAQEIGLEVDDAVKEYLGTVGFSDEFGARPLRRAIQAHVGDVLADAILAGDLAPGATARLILDGEQVRVRTQAGVLSGGDASTA